MLCKESQTFEDYKKCVEDENIVYRQQTKNKKYEIHSLNEQKKALNRDDSRWKTQADRIVTLAKGYAA